jgi:hypothetical protein
MTTLSLLNFYYPGGGGGPSPSLRGNTHPHKSALFFFFGAVWLRASYHATHTKEEKLCVDLILPSMAIAAETKCKKDQK